VIAAAITLATATAATAQQIPSKPDFAVAAISVEITRAERVDFDLGELDRPDAKQRQITATSRGVIVEFY
jgi:hypothetical protein